MFSQGNLLYVAVCYVVLPISSEPHFLPSCLGQGPEMCFLHQIRLAQTGCLGFLMNMHNKTDTDEDTNKGERKG